MDTPVSPLRTLFDGKRSRIPQKEWTQEFRCATSCASLFFFKGPETIAIGVLGAMFAAIGYAGSIVFYNAFLPEIAEPQDQDRVSAKGFALCWRHAMPLSKQPTSPWLGGKKLAAAM